MQSVVTSDGVLGTETDNKLSGTLALGKTAVVTGLNGVFPSPLVLLSQSQLVLLSQANMADTSWEWELSPTWKQKSR